MARKSGNASPPDRAYWDQVVEQTVDRPGLPVWQQYMKHVYGSLISSWFEDDDGVALKTDLFEEAVSAFPPLADLGANSVGMDTSVTAVRDARHRLGPVSRRLVVADLRQLPLRSGAVSRILSGSSLDHFSCKEDIARGLSELARVARPGAVLILTLDNPHNPIVWLRNALPQAPLRRVGLVPYHVGPTYTRTEAYSALGGLAFSVTDCAYVAHAPRAPAIWLLSLLARFGNRGLDAPIGHALARFEVLRRSRVARRTGYYLALRGVRLPAGGRA